MKPTLDMAQLLIACWLLGTGEETIPTSHGILDKALSQVVGAGGLPEWVRRRLHFSDTRVGLRCVELDAILQCAQSALLTSVPNPSYQVTKINASPALARAFLRRLDVGEDQARTWGTSLLAAANTAENGVPAGSRNGLEEY
jgi:hypothetical protein